MSPIAEGQATTATHPIMTAYPICRPLTTRALNGLWGEPAGASSGVGADDGRQLGVEPGGEGVGRQNVALRSGGCAKVTGPGRRP
jgi:hypothetical protein